MAWVLPALNIAADVFGAMEGKSSAAAANAANLKNSREQRAWEANMANTAVQRRKDDIVKAGFNPLLAATGAGAATPSVSVPTMEPTFRPEWTKGSVAEAMQTKANYENVSANTALTMQKAREQKVISDNAETFGKEQATQKTISMSYQADQERHKAEILKQTRFTTAAEREVAEKTVDAAIQLMNTQAAQKKLDFDQVKALVDSFGLGAASKTNLIKQLLGMFLELQRSK